MSDLPRWCAVTERPPLWHFTCSHGAHRIGNPGELLPLGLNPLLGCRVVWLTTEREPDRFQTGLTRTFVKCDRMEYRYRVTDASRCRPWSTSLERFGAVRWVVEDLERYGDPEHWFVASRPVPVVLDP